jgi:hypothetical protein
VTHGNAVEILNVDTGVKAEPITGLKGVHGVAFAPKRDRGYISNGRGNSVSVFDLKTGKVLADVPSSGQNPDAVMYDAFSDRVFTFNGRTANATAIDAATNKVVGTVDIGGKPEFAVTDGKAIFVNNEDTSEIVAFDAKSSIKTRWSIAPARAGGLASTSSTRLFSVRQVIGRIQLAREESSRRSRSAPDAVATIGTGSSSPRTAGHLTVVRQESRTPTRSPDGADGPRHPAMGWTRLPSSS